jgi:hypothetical protein
MDVRLIEDMTITAAVAATAQVSTITPTNAASSEFSIQISMIVNGMAKQVVLSTVTAASGSSATTICDAWRAQIAPLITSGQLDTITATGTSTLILTASTTVPIFTVTQVYMGGGNVNGFTPAIPSGVIGIVLTTPGVVPNGTYATLTAQGITTVPALVSGQSYSQIRIVYRQTSDSERAGDVAAARNVHTVLYNASATNHAALDTKLTRIIAGILAGGAADPAFIAIA